MCSSLLSVAVTVIKHFNQKQLRAGKDFFGLCFWVTSSREVRTETLSRNMEEQ